MSIFPWRRYLRNLSARRSSSFHMPGGRGKQMLYAEASSRKFQRSKSKDRIQEPVSKMPSVADASDSDEEDESRLSVESISNAIHAMP
ncbi:hypothetical protein Nepgr_009599 [Nepenthes gracilis]|uniref:Uncharacterized protein n=1 Tax=Nepenthes gracilis TaxID=150966 RepID=A0AAD3SBQ1_NEPGR|nr:hypothetical protein Nepgr_009599 [Nepenthes gracilis]